LDIVAWILGGQHLAYVKLYILALELFRAQVELEFRTSWGKKKHSKRYYSLLLELFVGGLHLIPCNAPCIFSLVMVGKGSGKKSTWKVE